MNVYTVEDINPKSHAIRDLRMVVKRARMLDEMMKLYIEWCDLSGVEEPVDYMREHPPHITGVNAIRTLMEKIFGKHYRNHAQVLTWDMTFDMWWSGAVRRSARDATLNMPASVRETL